MQNFNQTPEQGIRIEDQSSRNVPSFRAVASMPLAAVFTAGLTLSMAALIATEFTPQDKSETLKLDINPVEKIADITPVVEPPKPYKTVETPPPPPVLAIKVTDQVAHPIIREVGRVPVFKMTKLNLGKGVKMIPTDRDPQPLVRVPPQFPARFAQGQYSGVCQIRFDVSKMGKPYNVVATDCTDRALAKASEKAVLKWQYNPKIVDGLAVDRAGLQTKLRFDLRDAAGEVLPLPR